jgi:Fe-S cluster assembly iron-binding protein IscA
MLQITDDAMARMQRALSEEGEDGNDCFRIVVTESSVELIRDKASSDDVAYKTREGMVVLVMDAACGQSLEDRTIDFDEAESSLVLR